MSLDNLYVANSNAGVLIHRLTTLSAGIQFRLIILSCVKVGTVVLRDVLNFIISNKSLDTRKSDLSPRYYNFRDLMFIFYISTNVCISIQR